MLILIIPLFSTFEWGEAVIFLGQKVATIIIYQKSVAPA